MQQQDSDDELETFINKVRTLNNIASNLNDVINSQNDRLTGFGPQMGNTFSRLQNMVLRISKTDGKRFRGWIYYSGATLLIFFIIFIFFIVF